MLHTHPDALVAPIELKGDEGDNAAAIVTKALDNLKAEVNGRLDKIEARQNRPAAGTVETKSAADIERKAFMDFARVGPEHMGADERKSLVVGDGTGAGYLAPKQIGDELIKLLVQFSPIRSYATIKSITGRSITYPRRTGSIAASWVGEIDPRPTSEPSFEQIELTPGELVASTVVSTQLLEDNAYDLEGELLSEFAEQFGVAEGGAFVSGNGVKKPVGILNNAAIKVLSAAAATFTDGSEKLDTLNVVLAMFHALPQVHAQNGTWLMNRTTLAQLRKFTDSTGHSLILDNMTSGPTTSLLGRPIVEAIDMPDIASGATPILFGDLKAYRIIDRVDFQLLRDPYTLAGTGQVKFLARKRVGGDLTHPDRLVKLKIS